MWSGSLHVLTAMNVRSMVRPEAVQGRRRAIAKTALYRMLMVCITVGVAFAVTDDPAAALNIGVAANVVKTGTYYGYERLWDRIDWGLAGVAD